MENAKIEKTLAKQAATYAACCATEQAAIKTANAELTAFSQHKLAVDTNRTAALVQALADAAFYGWKRKEITLNANSDTAFRVYLAKLQIGGKPEEQKRLAQDATGKQITITGEVFDPLENVTKSMRRLALLLLIGHESKVVIGRREPGKSRQFGYNDAFAPLGNVSYRDAAKAGVIAVCVPRNVVVPSLVKRVTLPGAGKDAYEPYAPNTDEALIHLRDRAVIDALYDHHFADAALAFGYNAVKPTDWIIGTTASVKPRGGSNGTGEAPAESVLDSAIRRAVAHNPNTRATADIAGAAIMSRGEAGSDELRAALYKARAALHMILHAKDRTGLLKTPMIAAEIAALFDTLRLNFDAPEDGDFVFDAHTGAAPLKMPVDRTDALPVGVDLLNAALDKTDSAPAPAAAAVGADNSEAAP